MRAGEALQANDTHGIELASQWDAYHTIRNLCYLVPEDIQRPKLVNCVPGSEAFTLKKTLVHVLQVRLVDRFRHTYTHTCAHTCMRALQHPTYSSQDGVAHAVYTLYTHAPPDTHRNMHIHRNTHTHACKALAPNIRIARRCGAC